nr:MAG TPA_asm: hypothetical protein [Inoviridae sp.]
MQYFPFVFHFNQPFCGLWVIRFPFVCIYYNTYTRILQ